MTFTHTQHVGTCIFTLWKLSVLWTCIGEFEHLLTCSSVICINFSAAWPFVSVSYTVFLLNCYYFLFKSSLHFKEIVRWDVIFWLWVFFFFWKILLLLCCYICDFICANLWIFSFMGFVSCFRFLVVCVQV